MTTVIRERSGEIYMAEARCRDIENVLRDVIAAHGDDAPIHIRLSSGKLTTKAKMPWDVDPASPYAPAPVELTFDWADGRGRSGFHPGLWLKFDLAAAKAEGFARLVNLVHKVAPFRQVLITAEYLGAAVALRAFPKISAPNISKVFLFRAAEFGIYALRAAKTRAGRACRFFNFRNPKRSFGAWSVERMGPRPGPADMLLSRATFFKTYNWTDITAHADELDLMLEDIGYREAWPEFEENQIGVVAKRGVPYLRLAHKVA